MRRAIGFLNYALFINFPVIPAMKKLLSALAAAAFVAAPFTVAAAEASARADAPVAFAVKKTDAAVFNKPARKRRLLRSVPPAAFTASRNR